MATRTASTTEELYSALKASGGGDVIKLAPGNYGDVWLYDMAFGSEVVIESADPSNPAIFQSAKFQFVTNVTFDHVMVDFVPDQDTSDHSSAVLITDSASITIRNSVLEGGVSVAGIDPDSAAGAQGFEGILGKPIGRGITTDRSSDISIENNDISVFFKGMVLSNTDGANIVGNDVHDLRGSPLVGANLDNINVESNYFREIFPWKLGGTGDHADMIHFWVASGQDTPNENIVIRDNFFEQGEGVPIFGIFLESGTGSYKNVTIDGNVLHNGESQGFVLAAVDGLTVTNNTLLQSSGGINDAPKIALIAGTKNAILSDNITAGFYGDAYDNATANNIRTSGNLVVDYNDREAPNYVGNLFINSAHSADSLDNIRIIPGSPADGLGSHLSAVDSTPDHVIAGFQVSSIPENGNVLVFDASTLTFGPAGVVDDGTAEFTWNFGDGYKATGALVQRTFTEPGRYDVTLTVKSADGSVAKAVYQVGVAGDELVSYNPASGEFTSFGYGDSEVASATIEKTATTDGQTAIVLGGPGVQANLGKTAFEDLFGSDNFAMSFSMKSTAGAASSGEIFRVHGTFVARVDDAGHFVFEFTPKDSATLVSISTGPTLNDGKLHDISIEFDGAADRVSILIDGELAGTLRTPSVIRDDLPRDMTFGNPWGGTNYKGEIHEFSISSYKPDYKLFSGDTGAVSTLVQEDHTSLLKSSVNDWVLDIDSLDSSGNALRHDAEVVDTGTGAAIAFDGEKDFVGLGRQRAFENSEKIAVSVDFTRAAEDDTVSKIFWSKEKLGAKLVNDDLIVRVKTVDEGFKSFRIKDAGLDDNDLHNTLILVDGESDRMQILIDGQLMLDEVSTDFNVTGDSGWRLSANGIRAFQGEISDFRMDDDVAFVDDDVQLPDTGYLV